MTPQSRLQQQPDARVWLRYPAPATYVKVGEGNGFILNISEGGLAVKILGSVAQGQMLPVTFLFARSQNWIETRGRIAWRDESKKATGVEFLDLPDEAREQIRKWISLETGLAERTNVDEEPDDRRMDLKSKSSLPQVEVAREQGPTSSGYTGAREIPFPVRIAPAISSGESGSTPVAEKLRRIDPVTEVAEATDKTEAYSRASGDRGHQRLQFRGLLLLVASSVIVSILIAGFFEFRSMRSVSGSVERSGVPTQSRLGLAIEHAGRDWRLSWNPDAPAISAATKGRLLITDGALRKVLDLDPSDLRSGTIMYTPLTDEVVLRLEVENATPQGTISESIRIASGALPSVPAQTPSAAFGQSRKDGSRNAPPVISPARGINDSRARSTVSTSDGPSPSEPMAPVLPSEQPKISSSPGLTETRPTPPSQVVQPDIPAPPSQAPQLGATSNLNAEPPPQPAAVASPDAVPRMSKLEPAQLIDRKNPIYPAVERTVHVSGSVQVRFHIGSDGRVSDVTVVSGNAILAKAAVDAVQGWRYKPATLNGTPIETEGSAVLAFTP